MELFHTLRTSPIRLILGGLAGVALVWTIVRSDQPRLAGRPISFWISQLDHPKEARHIEVNAVLASRPDLSLPELRQLLGAKDGAIRRTLLRIREAHPSFPLRLISADIPRAGAAEVLLGFQDRARPATADLVEALRLSRRPATIEAVQDTLVQLRTTKPGDLLPLLHEPSSELRERGIHALGLMHSLRPFSFTERRAVADVTSRQLADPDCDLVMAATRLLLAMGPGFEESLPGLINNLRRPEAGIRQASAEALGALGSVSAGVCVAALEDHIQDPVTEVRVAVITALGRFGSNAIPVVSALATMSTAAEVRVAVASANSLARIGKGADAAVPSLIAGLEQPRPILRAASAAALGRIGAEPERAVPALGRLLQDDDPYVRQNAVRSLAAFGPDALPAMSALIGALRDPLESVRVEAASALGQLGSGARAAIPYLQSARNNNQSVMTRPVLAAIRAIEGHPPERVAAGP